jgi:hypothetical protein
MSNTSIRCYTELVRIADYYERYKYLRLHSAVGIATFGFDRYVNQMFYTSSEWKHVRNIVIDRDRSCDLGVEGYEIHDRIIIHHMNPITIRQVERGEDVILDPEYLISVTHRTHNAIHYGDEGLLVRPLVARRPGDTKLW